MKKQTAFCFAIACLCPFYLFAQIFSGTPAGLRWKQLRTDTARVIFAKGQDSLAQRVGALVHYQQQQTAYTLGHRVYPISIILRNELTYFNGYVGLGPFRSEYYLTPPQDAFALGSLSVTDLLSLHEYRHVQQYNYFRKGLAKAAYLLFGENGQALANDAAIPNWFFEGDAVYNETLLSQQGRGRLPYFFNGYKALYYDHRDYSYMKLRNGSFKHYVPDHYPLGYMLVSYGKEKYGSDFWNKVTDGAARFKPLIYPMQGSLKKAADIPYKRFVDSTFRFYQQQWATEKKDAVKWITDTKKRNVVSYRYPYSDGSSGLIVLKQSYKTLPRFYRVDTAGREKEIALQSITNDDYFSYNNGKIIYTAYQPSTRWGYREYSVVKLLDIKTHRERRVTNKSRYFSPDISHDGNTVAAVSVSAKQLSSVDIMNVHGFKLASFAAAGNEIYSYPKFSSDDKSLFVMVRKPDGEMSLQQWNLTTKQRTLLLPFANRILGFPVVQGDTLYYSCSNKGKDEIWAYVAGTQQHYRIADFQTGLYGAAATGNQQVAASAFTASGYRLGYFAAQWQAVTLAPDTLTGLYVKKPFGVPANHTVEAAPQATPYAASHYNRLSHPFNFHSLQPDYSNPLFSLTLYGENVLGTIQNRVYYNYNQNERYSQAGYNLTYGLTYLQPFIDVSEVFGRRTIVQRKEYTYNEFNGIAGLQLPLNISGGKEMRYLTLQSAYGINNPQFTGDSKAVADNFIDGYFQSQVSFVSQRQRALQHIYPHWAQSVLLRYRTKTSNSSARQFLARGSVYLPGLLSSHSLVLDGAYQAQYYGQQTNQLFTYSFSDNFPYSRGYSAYNYPNMYKAGVNYHLPLVYPDFGVANVVYLRRVRANLFFDYTKLRGTVNNQYFNDDLKSAGAEVYIDTRWWNQQSITLGIRYSRLLDYKLTGDMPNSWTLILPSSIFQ